MFVLMCGTDVSTMGGISSVVRNYIDHGMMERLGVRYMPTHRDGSKLGKVLFYLGQFPRIVVTMPRVRIVHIHTSQGWSFRRLFALFLFARIFGRKTVWHVHGSQFDTFYRSAVAPERMLIRYAFRSADAVIALSDAWKTSLLTIEPSSKVSVVHNAVNVKAYAMRRDEQHDPVTVLFLGRLGQRKGIYDLLKAIEQLKSERVRFVLAGDGDLDQIRAKIAGAGPANRVDVPGWVSSDRVIGLLRDADIYILPSYDEGLPMGVLEAMAAGLPVVSTPVGGIPEAVLDGVNGFLVDPGDVSALAGRLKSLVDDPEMWSRMSEASRGRAVEAFGMERVEIQLLSLYRGLGWQP